MSLRKIYLLGLIGGLGTASSDIYVSLLPNLCNLQGFSPEHMNITFVAYFIAMCCTSLIYPFSVAFLDRTRVILYAGILFTLSLFVIAFSSSLPFILLSRALQGAAFGFIQPAIIVVIKAAVQESANRNLAAFSFASEVLAISMPTIGVVSFYYGGWPGPFIVLGILSSLLFVRFFVQKQEFSVPVRPPAFSISNLRVLSQPRFLRFNLMSFLMAGVGWGLLTTSSYIYQDPTYHSMFFTAYVVVYAAGCWVCQQEFWGPQKILKSIPTVMMILGSLLAYSIIQGNLVLITLGILLFSFFSGVTFAPIVDQALHKMNASDIDLASAVLFACRLFASALFVWSSTQLYFYHPMTFSALILLSCALLISLARGNPAYREKKMLDF